MASKTRYTEAFQRKVVEEFKKGSISLEDMAAKYDIPSALLKHWIAIDGFNDFFVTVNEVPAPQETSSKRIRNLVKKLLRWIVNKRWLIAGCLSLMIIGVFLVNLRSCIIQSEEQDNIQPTIQKLDTLIKNENEVKAKLERLEGIDSTLKVIEYELEMRITPMVYIQSKKPICNCKNDTIK